MLQSPNDQKAYQTLTLANGLRTILVHDPEAPRAAAALCINVGHFDDPKDRHGMAHFLEHMLFLGTEKYPIAGDFQKFINRHGGNNNAWTGTEHTCFFFDVQPGMAFDEALDRFSQFFIAPLFIPELVEKERQSVESEYQLKKQDDVRRLMQVQKQTINPDHPFAKFSVGNAETLADDANQADGNIRQELLAFYQQHYSSHLMTLAVISPEPLEHQYRQVQPLFEAIERKAIEKAPITTPILRPQDNQIAIYVQPIKDIRKLTLSFDLPDLSHLYRSKPLSYIAHLLGDEGPGSLMAYLKKQGWITALSAGGGLSGSNFREFSISVALTEEGLSQTDTIAEACFAYLQLIRERGIDAWRYQEKHAVMEMAFRYQEPTKPLDTVSYLATNLHHYAPEDVIYGDYVMNEFNAEQVRSLLDKLTPNNMRLTLVTREPKQAIEWDQRADWYATPYHCAPLSEAQLARWQQPAMIPALALAPENPFIPERLSPLPIEKPQSIPQLLENRPGFRLWHKQDTIFNVPKGILFVAIDSPVAVASVENIVRTRLCVELLMDAINESAYPAEVAGISYNLYAHQGGVTLQLSGFSEKQPELLQLIIQRFVTRHFKTERFESIKTQLKRSWTNASQEKPISQLFNQLTGILQPNNPCYPALLRALEQVEVDQLGPFVDAMLKEIFVEVFVYGNWHRDQARHIAQDLKEALRVENQSYIETGKPLAKIHGRGTLIHPYNVDHEDSAVLVYHQSESTSAQAIATFLLTNHLMSATFFHELRTKQQLGYMVGTGNLPLNQHPGLIFYIQSPVASPKELMQAIDTFINHLALLVIELNDAQWQASKAGLIAQVEAPDTNLRQRGQRYWNSIGLKDWQFDQRERIAKALKKVRRVDVIRFVVNALKPRTADRMVLCSVGHRHQGADPFDLGSPVGPVKPFHQANSNRDDR
ncbi:Protease 3 [Vibrio stylophorae]|uniref:Protease 3 n=1 Tax=Vibrio stylophorae TaxID=659351 RepID=A0ABN8DSB5_9VIBR|nr:insulinase family protein [Vibrio stylophorae]CAH0533994.1 Protease 3 [Vibrio stylophorae]